jgi:ketosteroid isomerase-like protein
MAHPNAQLLARLFSSLDRHDHESMADCYQPDATFTDIAFNLRGRKRIQAMWHMASEGDIRTTFDVKGADDREGLVRVVDDYTFRSTGNKVRNVIESHFQFRDGRISDQRDACDPRKWADMALGGGLSGFLAGRFRFLRSRKAAKLLDAFIESHPQYK